MGLAGTWGFPRRDDQLRVLGRTPSQITAASSQSVLSGGETCTSRHETGFYDLEYKTGKSMRNTGAYFPLLPPRGSGHRSHVEVVNAALSATSVQILMSAVWHKSAPLDIVNPDALARASRMALAVRGKRDHDAVPRF